MAPGQRRWRVYGVGDDTFNPLRRRAAKLVRPGLLLPGSACVIGAATRSRCVGRWRTPGDRGRDRRL